MALLGFRTVVGKAAYSRASYSVGQEKLRAFDINEMFENNDIDGIMCIAGGSSTAHVLPHIDFDVIKRNPKPFIGFSDISVLLNPIYAKTDMITFHGPMALSKFRGDTKKYFFRSVAEDKPAGMLPKSWHPLKRGECSGRIVGGNLATLATIVGTRYDVDWKNKIFFWEEIHESPSDIALMLMRFKLAGIFDKISGMVIGKLKHCDYKRKNDIYGISVNEVVLEMTKEYNFPIITGFPAGHFARNITLPIGANARINTGRREFVVEESAVS